MRKQLSKWLAIAFVTLFAPAAQAQTTQKIVDQHIKALGGAKALKNVTSVRLSGTTNGGGEFLWQTRAPSSYYLEVRQGDAHSIEAFNGKSAWREDKSAGARTLTGKEQARARAAGAYRNDHFLTYKKDKTRVNLLGRETVEGRSAFAVEVTTVAGIQRKVLFDAQTYLILKEEQERDSGKEEILFGDYRAVDGVQEPHRIRIRIRHGGEMLDLRVEKVTHNGRVEAAMFDFPRRGSAPLPDIATLFKLVIENQKNLEKAQENYTYTKVENDIEIDDKGRIKQKSERTYEVFYVNGDSVEKLVARDGQPLKEDEARKEQQRVEKIIRESEENRKKVAERKAREGQKKAEGKKQNKDEDEDVSISNILRVCQFVNPRRERFRGQEVVVYDFEPRPGEKPRSRGESLIRTLVGAIWIDEQARQIVRVEARMNDAFKMGGGLVASLQRGSSFVFEQEMVKGEVWLPSYAEVNASARVLLVKGFKINQTQRFSDYKKFNVDSTSEIKPPKQ